MTWYFIYLEICELSLKGYSDMMNSLMRGIWSLFVFADIAFHFISIIGYES